MAIYSEIVGATNFKRKKYKVSAENYGTYVITLSTNAKQKLVDLAEFSESVELNDLEFVNAIKQKSDLKGWNVAFEVSNGTTIIVGKIISVIWQSLGVAEQCIATCILSNGAYVVLTIANENQSLNATLSSSGQVGSGAKVITLSNITLNANGTSDLVVSEEVFASLIGDENIILNIELTSGETLNLYRTKYDSDSASFANFVIYENGEYLSDLYGANFTVLGGKLYEIGLFEPNVEIPNGVEPIKLETFKALGEYFELGSGLTATVDEANKTIDIIVG